MIVFSLFIINYIIFAVVPLIATWDLRSHDRFKRLDKKLDGVYPDFSPQWFDDVGHIIYATMKTNMIMPLAELIYMYLWRYSQRALD